MLKTWWRGIRDILYVWGLMAKKKLDPPRDVLVKQIPGADILALDKLARKLSVVRGKKVHRTDLMREGYRMVLAKEK